MTRSPASGRRPLRYKLAFEQLEDRTVPTAAGRYLINARVVLDSLLHLALIQSDSASKQLTTFQMENISLGGHLCDSFPQLAAPVHEAFSQAEATWATLGTLTFAFIRRAKADLRRGVLNPREVRIVRRAIPFYFGNYTANFAFFLPELQASQNLPC